MDLELTAEECTEIIAAIDCWEKDVGRNGMMGDLMAAMIMRKASPEEKEKYELEQKRRLEKERMVQRERTDKAALLKAKFILKRREIESTLADQIITVARQDVR